MLYGYSDDSIDVYLVMMEVLTHLLLDGHMMVIQYMDPLDIQIHKILTLHLKD